MVNRTEEEVKADKNKFLEVYPTCKSVQEAAERVGVSRKCAYNWIKNDESLGIEHYVRRALEKHAPVEKLISMVGRIATDENIKVGMPNLAAAQYLLNVQAPNIFGKYKEERREQKITRMTVRKDKGNGKIETEEYEIKEASVRDTNPL